MLLATGCSGGGASPDAAAPSAEEPADATTALRERCVSAIPEGVELAPLATSLPSDGLVVMAPSDGRAAYDDAEALADAAGLPFVAGRSGHGWELLVDPVSGSVTRIGRRLVSLATGR